ncbi:DUF2188 domain-containing protein [Streptomyces tubercidicus]|uniref:DUF2188 domain-containing protein n=1 Tax=Streptomyces platensis TaxID=58346 RepID=UPI002ED41C50|nr:DUF2188 domain-containing protein [Streptomyces platensis]
MTKPKTYHVTQRSDGKWQAKAEGAARASTVAGTQAAADRRAAEISRNSGGGEVVRHGRDGSIKDKRTIAPGSDPYPPKG